MTLTSGAVFQLCWVVADIDAAERHLTEHFGVAKWLRIPDVAFTPETATLRGEPADYVIHVSLGYAGRQQLELIQPVSGNSLYAEHLADRGPGLHHVAWVPDDFDATVAEAGRRGMAVTQRGAMPDVGMSFAYLEGGPLGSHVELMQMGPEIRAMFDALAAESG